MSGLQRTAPAAPHPHSPRYLLHVCWPAIWRARGCQATIVFEISQNRVNRLKTIFHIFPYLSISDCTNRHTHTFRRHDILCGALPNLSWGGKSSLEGCHSIKMPWPTNLLRKKKDTSGNHATIDVKIMKHPWSCPKSSPGGFVHASNNGGKWWKQNPIWRRVMQSGLSASEADTPFLPMTSRCVRISAKNAGLTGVIKHAGVYNKESEAHLTKYLIVYCTIDYSYNWLMVGDTSSQNPYIFGDGETWRPIMAPITSFIWGLSCSVISLRCCSCPKVLPKLMLISLYRSLQDFYWICCMARQQAELPNCITPYHTHIQWISMAHEAFFVGR